MLLVDNITHQYPAMTRPVLREISFALGNSEQLLLRGISGSGKTTLINTLAGLLTPTEGTIRLDEQSLYTLNEAERDDFRRQSIGYVFQTHHLLPILSAWENVAMPLAFVGVGKGERRQRALELLEAVGLAELANNRPNQLSNGQRQRVAIARALIHRPMLVLADEPTASLDAESAETVITLLQQTCLANDAILIVASHDPTLAPRFDRIADLAYGQWEEANTQ